MLISTFLFLLSGLLPAQVGKLRGLVTDKQTGKPIPVATVVIEETPLAAYTDLNGVYVVLGVPLGVYTVRTAYIGYQSVAISNIRIHANLTTTKDFSLTATDLEMEVLALVAQRPLIHRNTTNTSRLLIQEDIQNLPIRGLKNLISLEAGTVLQDGDLHVRGGRAGEIAYFIDGVTATNPYSNEGNVSVIQEAIEEIQLQSGGYTAEFGGSNSAIVYTTLRTGGPKFKATIYDYRTDEFAGPGDQFLGTSSFGYRNAVLTLSGPIPLIPKLRFFAAAQYNYQGNRTPSFVEPFNTNEWIDPKTDTLLILTDDGYEGRTVGDTLPDGGYGPGIVKYDQNHLPDNWKEDNSIQGTLVYSLSDAIKLRFTGNYRGLRFPVRSDNFYWSLYKYFNDRRAERRERWGLASLRVTHILSPNTFYEVTLSYSKQSAKRIDPEIGDDWRAYVDGAEAVNLEYAEKYGEEWQTRFLGPMRYSTINNFVFEAPGFPINQYEKNSQINMGGALDFTTQLNKEWELKAGARFDQWSMRRFNIRHIRALLEVEFGPDGTSPKDFAAWAQQLSDLTGREYTEEQVRWATLGRTGSRLRPIIYGYDIDGNEVDKFPNGPREPFFGSFYVQNKFEYSDLIINLGLRFERIDIKAPKPRSNENPAFNESLDWIDETKMTETDPYDYVLPRVTFSFPISNRTVLYTLYGEYLQMPALSHVYRGIPEISHTVSPVTRSPYGYFGNWVGYTANPERTKQHEMGIRQSLTENSALTITVFYKDLRDQLRIDRVYSTGAGDIPEGEVVFSGYRNKDFGTVKGAEFSLEMRRTKRLSAKVNYTLSITRGTGSDPRSSVVAVSDNVAALYPTMIYPLDYHQTHRGSVLLDYRFSKGDGGKILQGMGMNLLLTFNSGHAYTKIEEPQNLGGANPWNVGVRALSDPRFRNPEEPLNSSLTPWNFNVDLNLNKVFYFGKFNVDVYIQVLNLLDTKHVINFYPTTGTPEDDGWLISPLASSFHEIPNYVEFYRAINRTNSWNYQMATGKDIYGTPRQIRFGIKLVFK